METGNIVDAFNEQGYFMSLQIELFLYYKLFNMMFLSNSEPEFRENISMKFFMDTYKQYPDARI